MKDDLQKAKEFCYLLLKARDRSEKEILQRLSAKKFSTETIEHAIQDLKTSGLVNDRQFARNWIQTRLSKSYGLKRINFELREKGISDGLASEELSQLLTAYPQEDVVLSLIKERARRYRKLDVSKRKQRLFAYLIARGFSSNIINQEIKKFFKSDDECTLTKFAKVS